MRKNYLITLALSTLFLTQCEVYREGCTDPYADNYNVAADINDGSCTYTIDITDSDCESASEGNLVITNETGETLLLYCNVNEDSSEEYTPITCIPANTEEFITYISSDGNTVYTLQIWKASSVDDQSQPDLSNVYRQWSVALANNTMEEERASWLITDSDANLSSGTLIFSYPETDENDQEVIYQVDVYLNSKTGSRIATLQPGADNKVTSVDYGIHYLYFYYWYSDPNSASDDITEIGWNEVSGVVVNAEHESVSINIPTYESTVGKYGYLKVFNTSDEPISVYADDDLIENIAKVDGSTDGLSIIPSQNSTSFVIPEDNYAITGKSYDGSTSIVTFKSMDIIDADTAICWIGEKMQEVSIINNTDSELYIYSIDDEYLGKIIEAESSSGTFLVKATYDSLVAISSDKTQKITVNTSLNIEIDSLIDYDSQEFTITSAWDQNNSNYYISPDIDNSESTSMTATLFNSTNITLNFEYKVSSEYNYDMFSFSIDGETQLKDISGETEWISYSTSLSSGSHTIKWTYTKDSMFSVGDDNVIIRNISVE